MATENFTSISGINYILEQIKIENNYLNCDNIVFYIIICIMAQINAALVSIRDFFINNVQNLTDQTFEL